MRPRSGHGAAFLPALPLRGTALACTLPLLGAVVAEILDRLAYLSFTADSVIIVVVMLRVLVVVLMRRAVMGILPITVPLVLSASALVVILGFPVPAGGGGAGLAGSRLMSRIPLTVAVAVVATTGPDLSHVLAITTDGFAATSARFASLR